jgi:hypothetical protein
MSQLREKRHSAAASKDSIRRLDRRHAASHASGMTGKTKLVSQQWFAAPAGTHPLRKLAERTCLESERRLAERDGVTTFDYRPDVVTRRQIAGLPSLEDLLAGALPVAAEPQRRPA